MLKILGNPKAFLILFMVGIAGVLGWAVLYALFFRDTSEQARFRVSPETTYYVSPIREDGSVDFAAAINDELGNGIAPDDNAYALLLQAIGPLDSSSPELYQLLGTAPSDETSVRFHEMKAVFTKVAASNERVEALLEIESELRSRPWRREDYPEIVQWLERNRDPLEKVHHAVACDRYFRPLVTHDENGNPILIMEDSLAGIEQLRGLARLLTMHAMLSLQEGETQTAWEDLIACRRLGRLAAQGPSLIDVLVGYSIEGTAEVGIAALLSHSSPDAETITRYQADLAALPPIMEMKTVIDRTERCNYLEVIQAIAKGRAEAAESLDTWDAETLAKLSGPGFYWNDSLIEANARYDALVQGMELPTYSVRTQTLEKFEEDLMADTKPGPVQALYRGQAAMISQTFLMIMLPATSTARMAEDRVRQRAANLDTALALAKFRDTHGHYPDSLTELVPDFLDEPPQDLFNASELAYRPSEDGYTLYSVGADLVDQGGSDKDGADDLSFVMNGQETAPQ
ncbi:hypothetical protein [Bremerella sp.]|uniref:hypothetical protein n=1 Tax=Bremerella sp. TaxID=2795602 RepID=UPI00391C7D82